MPGAAAPVPGTVFQDCSECPEMVVIPAGRFAMGSSKKEAGRNDDEGPVHDVEIPYVLAVSKYEVTIDQFRPFADSSPDWKPGWCRVWQRNEWASRWTETEGRNWSDPGYPVSGSNPVTCVSWVDAQAYVRWLRERTGRAYRLLSEAEWEYAARGGTTTRFHFGDLYKRICKHANIADRRLNAQWAGRGCDDGFGKGTAPVGSLAPNAFGLHDVHGNVWEWIEDCWNESYVDSPVDGTAWTDGDCARRVSRGGAWDTIMTAARSANRRWSSRDYRISNTGFRIARPLTETEWSQPPR